MDRILPTKSLKGLIVTDLTVLSTDPASDATWWRQAVVYQVHLRSFSDGDGDGLGDLPGLTSRIGYLAGLGVDAIWLSPLAPSAPAGADHDLADRRAVDPQLGTLGDVDDLVATAHEAGLKVIVDVAPLRFRADRGFWADRGVDGFRVAVDLLDTAYDAHAFADAIAGCLERAATSDTPSTWVLSNHDLVRHATRYALPIGTDLEEWLTSEETLPLADQKTGLRRARAATALILALPGSSYLYQGEELGLHEKTGRDGCRVPLPWHHEHTAYGSRAGTSWRPQPVGFSRTAVDIQEGVSGTTLEFYRQALRVRRQLQTSEELTWVDSGDPEVLHFVRPGGWHCVSNFGVLPVPLPDGVVRLSSGEHHLPGQLPGETTIWFTEWSC